MFRWSSWYTVVEPYLFVLIYIYIMVTVSQGTPSVDKCGKCLFYTKGIGGLTRLCYQCVFY